MTAKIIRPSLITELRRAAQWLEDHPELHSVARFIELNAAAGTTVVVITPAEAPTTYPTRWDGSRGVWDIDGMEVAAFVPANDPRWREREHLEAADRRRRFRGGRHA